MIGGNAARDTVRGRLLLEPPEFGTACPGYMHFPADRGPGYFEQLTADIITTKSINGRKVRTWETPKGRANEASDCRVYAYAALCGLAHFGLQLNKRAMRPSIPKEHTYVAPIVVPQYVPETNLAKMQIPNVENSRRNRLFAKLA